MVPTGEIIVSLTFAFVWTSSTTRAGTRVINNIQGKAAISGMSGSIGDREGGVANVHKIPTALNRSDVLTKALPTADFLRHRASLMDVPAESPM